jgi:hypothetical protein
MNGIGTKEARALAVRFRKHVIALPPGSSFEWRDMDAWAKRNCPFSSSREAYWDDFCIACMSLAEKLEKEGWLAYQNPEARTGDSDSYFRTAKELWD